MPDQLVLHRPNTTSGVWSTCYTPLTLSSCTLGTNWLKWVKEIIPLILFQDSESLKVNRRRPDLPSRQITKKKLPYLLKMAVQPRTNSRKLILLSMLFDNFGSFNQKAIKIHTFLINLKTEWIYLRAARIEVFFFEIQVITQFCLIIQNLPNFSESVQDRPD